MTLDSYIAGLKGKRIAVVGLGVSNMPLLRTLLSAGCCVTARDRRTEEAFGTEEAARLRAAGCSLRLGPDYLEDLSEDVIFRTPGLHPFTPQLAELQVQVLRTTQATAMQPVLQAVLPSQAEDHLSRAEHSLTTAMTDSRTPAVISDHKDI